MKLLVICGPTATGKTDLAIALANEFDGEVVSADSRQVYRGMDIVTGKDLPVGVISHTQIMNTSSGVHEVPVYTIHGIPVWMYDVINPDEDFSVAHFHRLASEVISDIAARGKLPILVGGTGLYIRAMTTGIGTLRIPPDPQLRQQASNMTVKQLQSLLKERAPDAWEKMNDSDRSNPRRLVRKIEIAARPAPEEQAAGLYDDFSVGLRAPKNVLDERINARVDARLEAGAIDEVASLLDQGYGWTLPSMSALGYRELREPVQTRGTGEYQEALVRAEQTWKLHERQYAGRQMTWFAKQPGIRWFDVSDSSFRSRIFDEVRLWYT